MNMLKFEIKEQLSGGVEMAEGERVTGIGVSAGLLIGSGIMALAYGIPEFQAVLPLVPRDASWWSLLVGTATLLVAIGGAYLATASYRMNRSISRSSRFKDAVGLLVNSHPASAFAGVAIIEQLCKEDPATYVSPAADALAHFSASVDEQSKRIGSIYGAMPTYDNETPCFHWPFSSQIGVHSFFVGTKLVAKNLEHLEEAGALFDGRFVFLEVYLSGLDFRSREMSGCRILQGVINNARFENCSFVNSHLNVVIGENVQFIRCDFSRALIHFHDRTGRPLLPNEADVLFEGCTFDAETHMLSVNDEEYLSRLLAWQRLHLTKAES